MASCVDCPGQTLSGPQHAVKKMAHNWYAAKIVLVDEGEVHCFLFIM